MAGTEKKIAVAYDISQGAKEGTQWHDANEHVINCGVTMGGRLALKGQSSTPQGEEEDTWWPEEESFPSIDEIMQ